MTPKNLWITGVSLFLFFVIACTPAKIAVSLLATTNDLELEGVSGTLWSGTAANIQYKGISFGEAHWQISPWSILLLSISTEIHTQNEQSKIDANINFSLNSISSDSIKARFPASWIPPLSGTPFKTQGKLLVRLIELEQSADSAMQLTGSIAWQDAVIQTPFSANKTQLGNLQVDISTQEETLLLDLRDNQGPLGLKAKIQFNPPNKIIVKGSVNESMPVELANFFRFFSKPDNKGKLIINYTGIIPGL